ncbi:MAG: hypothetical protein QF473_30055, partial [Planctomycetota bacterium]|nr:hypothetical protein [Planctomycetota bacterium]
MKSMKTQAFEPGNLISDTVNHLDLILRRDYEQKYEDGRELSIASGDKNHMSPERVPNRPDDCPHLRNLPQWFALLLVGLLIALPARAETPVLEFDQHGLSKVTWRDGNIIGNRRFVLERLVFETLDGSANELLGRAFADAPVQPLRVDVLAREKRIVHEYPWGSVRLVWQPGPDRLSLVLTLVNKSERAIADFQVRLLEFLSDGIPAALRRGVVRLALDRPVAFKLR